MIFLLLLFNLVSQLSTFRNLTVFLMQCSSEQSDQQMTFSFSSNLCTCLCRRGAAAGAGDTNETLMDSQPVPSVLPGPGAGTACLGSPWSTLCLEKPNSLWFLREGFGVKFLCREWRVKLQ